jgi:hypothetical protein
MKFLIILTALAISCGLVKANWVDDIKGQIKAELSYIGDYLDTSDSELATLSGTNDQQLAALRKHHDQQLSTMRGNHDSQLGLMRQNHDQQLDALWEAGYQPTFIYAEQIVCCKRATFSRRSFSNSGT